MSRQSILYIADPYLLQTDQEQPALYYQWDTNTSEANLETSAEATAETSSLPALNHWQSLTLAEIAEQAATDKGLTHLLLGGSCASFCQVSINPKQRKHIDQVLPFLLEEQLASDIETLHLAKADSDNKDSLNCLAIERNLLQALLQQLWDFDIHPVSASIDSLCLPCDSNGLTVITTAKQALVRSANNALTIERDNLTAALNGLQAADQPQQWQWLCEADNQASDGPLRLALEALSIEHDIQLSQQQGQLTDIIAQAYQSGQNPPVDLLQGDFKASQPKSTHSLKWKAWALAASLLFALQLTYNLGSGWYFDHQAQSLYQQSEDLYRQYFPQDKRIVNLRAQVNNHLRQGNQSAQGNQFLELLGKLGKSWQQPQFKTMPIQQIRYDNSKQQMTIELNAKAMADINNFQQQLSQQNLSARLLSANESDEGIRGRLQLQLAGGR